MRHALVVLIALAACGNDKAVDGTINDGDAQARIEFPDLAHLYGGDHGIYRGCGPNGGVCHNGNEFPNLDSMGSIVDTIGRDCNQKRDRADALHDMCETKGDVLHVKGTMTMPEDIEIASIVPIDGTGDPARQWKLTLRTAPKTFATNEIIQVMRGFATIAYLDLYPMASRPVLDPADPSRKTVLITLKPPVAGYDIGAETAKGLARTGIPGAGTGSIHVGDANRNGIFGADLGGKFIRPGDPARSYLLRRLMDPNAGPLMPRANCCFWTKPALRALWCWVAGLDAVGENAYAKINYDACPASPNVVLGYPDPGESCETAGLCPPVATSGTGDATFSSIYNEILIPKCSGDGCHDRDPLGSEVDMRDEATAWESLHLKVVAGEPDASILVKRLSPATCTGMCETMPLDRPLLDPAEVKRLRDWITNGALPED